MAQVPTKSKRGHKFRGSHAIGTPMGVPAVPKKVSLATRAKRALSNLNAAIQSASCGKNGACAVAKRGKAKMSAVSVTLGGPIIGGLWGLIALIALILFIVILTRLQCPVSRISGFGWAGIITTFVFPPAGLVLNSMGVANPARFCA